MAEGLEQALKRAKGVAVISVMAQGEHPAQEITFSENFQATEGDFNFEEIEPRRFACKKLEERFVDRFVSIVRGILGSRLRRMLDEPRDAGKPAPQRTVERNLRDRITDHLECWARMADVMVEHTDTSQAPHERDRSDVARWFDRARRASDRIDDLQGSITRLAIEQRAPRSWRHCSVTRRSCS